MDDPLLDMAGRALRDVRVVRADIGARVRARVTEPTISGVAR